jgi:hypothetical protein
MSDRKRRTGSVGNESGSASRITPAAPSRSGIPASAPPPSTGSTVEWNARAQPSPSDAAQTATPVPSSTSRVRPSTPAAPHPMSWSGASTWCTASSVTSGSATWAPAANSSTRSHGWPPSPSRATAAASAAPAAGSVFVESPEPMRTGMAGHDTQAPPAGTPLGDVRAPAILRACRPPT